MSKPADIVDALYERLAGLDFIMFKGRRSFATGEVEKKTCCAIYREAWERASDEGQRSRIDGRVIIEAHETASQATAADTGEALIANIRTAIETSNRTLTSLLLSPGLLLELHGITYPDNEESTVSVRLEYSVPHVESYGNP